MHIWFALSNPDSPALIGKAGQGSPRLSTPPAAAPFSSGHKVRKRIKRTGYIPNRKKESSKEERSYRVRLRHAGESEGEEEGALSAPPRRVAARGGPVTHPVPSKVVELDFESLDLAAWIVSRVREHTQISLEADIATAFKASRAFRRDRQSPLTCVPARGPC